MLLILSFDVCIYSGLKSIPTPHLPNFNAAETVVPVPLNGSKTIPPSGQVAMIGILKSSSGYTAQWLSVRQVSSVTISHTSLGRCPLAYIFIM